MFTKSWRWWVLLTMSAPASAQEFRDTVVPDFQIAAVVRDVAQWHDMQHVDCPFVKAVGSLPVEKSRDSSVEHWTIAACAGREFTYEVTIQVHPDGGVTDMVGNVDGKPVGIAADSAAPDAEECRKMREQFEQLNGQPSDRIDYSRLAQLAADLAVCSTSDPQP